MDIKKKRIRIYTAEQKEKNAIRNHKNYLAKKGLPEEKERRKKNIKKYRKHNKIKLNAKARIYRLNGSRVNNESKEKEYLEKVNNYHKEETKELRETYIYRQLRKDGYTRDQIKNNPELLEVKKLILKTKRLCKTLQTS